MENLRNRIRSLMNSGKSIVDDLDLNDLNYIDELMTELNKTGRMHTINRIKKKGNILDIETNYRITHMKS